MTSVGGGVWCGFDDQKAGDSFTTAVSGACPEGDAMNGSGSLDSGHVMTVLVADDDAGSLLVAQAAVEKYGHRCLVAADGEAAFQLYREHRPEAVVTDLAMPGMDGLELCRAIRATESDSYTYVVLLTSHGAPEDILAGMQAGADDYVTKPLDPFTLHTRLLAARRVTARRRFERSQGQQRTAGRVHWQGKSRPS